MNAESFWNPISDQTICDPMPVSVFRDYNPDYIDNQKMGVKSLKKTALFLCVLLTAALLGGCGSKPTIKGGSAQSSSSNYSPSSSSPSSASGLSASQSGSDASQGSEGKTVTVGASDPVAVVYFGSGGSRTAGVINLDGEFSVAPGKYAAISTFENNQAFAVTIGNGAERVYDIIDKNGKISNSFSQSKLGTNADWLFAQMDNFHDGVIPFGKEARYGLVNTSGEVILPMEYEEVKPFSDGLGAVMKDLIWQFVDTKGKVVIDLGKFSICESFSEGLAFFSNDQTSGYMDTQGVAAFSSKYGEIVSGFASYRGDFGEGVVPADVGISGKQGFGIMDKTGKILYYDINVNADKRIRQIRDGGRFIDGLFAVSTSTPLEFTGYGFIDTAGRLMIPIQTEWRPVGYRYSAQYYYENLDGHIGFYEGMCAAKKFSPEEKKIGFIDKTGKLVIGYKYDTVGRFSNGLAAVAIKSMDYEWSFIDAQGITVIPSGFMLKSKMALMTYASDFHQ